MKPAAVHFNWESKLTRQTNWAHVTDLDEITVAETCSSVVHVCRRWQHQLWTLLRVWQEHPLFRKHHHQHKAGPSTERRDSDRSGNLYCTLTKRYCARAIFCGILRYNPPVISQACKIYEVKAKWGLYINTVYSLCYNSTIQSKYYKTKLWLYL